MYTILFIVGILLSVAFGLFINFVGLWQVIEGTSPYLGDRGKSFKRLSPMLAALSAVLMVFFIALTIQASKNLAEGSCDAQGGVFKSWDSGFAWKCFQVEDPGAGQTIRVVD